MSVSNHEYFLKRIAENLNQIDAAPRAFGTAIIEPLPSESLENLVIGSIKGQDLDLIEEFNHELDQINISEFQKESSSQRLESLFKTILPTFNDKFDIESIAGASLNVDRKMVSSGVKDFKKNFKKVLVSRLNNKKESSSIDGLVSKFGIKAEPLKRYITKGRPEMLIYGFETLNKDGILMMWLISVFEEEQAFDEMLVKPGLGEYLASQIFSFFSEGVPQTIEGWGSVHSMRIVRFIGHLLIRVIGGFEFFKMVVTASKEEFQKINKSPSQGKGQDEQRLKFEWKKVAYIANCRMKTEWQEKVFL